MVLLYPFLERIRTFDRDEAATTMTRISENPVKKDSVTLAPLHFFLIFEAYRTSL